MLRASLGALGGALILPAMLLAQRPYDPTVAQAMTGTWVLVPDRSEPVPSLAATAEPRRDNPAAAVGGAPTGGGRRGGPPAGGPPSGGAPPSGRSSGGAGLRNPFVRELAMQLRAPEIMTFVASDTNVTIRVQEVEVGWTPDGKKHQKAMFDGTLLQNTARWKGDKLELIDGVEGAAELKRELHLIDDGAALEVKLELGGPGMPKKVSRRVVYTRQ